MRRTTDTNDVSRERIALGRIALLAREGNYEGARSLLAKCLRELSQELRLIADLRAASDNATFAALLADYVDDHMPSQRGSEAIRCRRFTYDSDPLYLTIAELDLEPKIVGMLENHLGVMVVADLDKHDLPGDLLEIPNFGQKSVEKLTEALRKAGVLEALRRRKLNYRHDAVGGLHGNRDKTQ